MPDGGAVVCIPMLVELTPKDDVLVVIPGLPLVAVVVGAVDTEGRGSLNAVNLLAISSI